MNIRFIAIDMDGTLLNRRGEISEENRAAIEEARNKGIVVSIATGRSYLGAKRLLDQVGLNLPLIHLNGAVIRSEEDEVLKEVCLDRDVVRDLHETLEKLGIYHELYTSEGIFANRNGYNHLKVEMDKLKTAAPEIAPELLEERAKKQFRTAEVKQRHLEDFLEASDVKIYKLLAFTWTESKLEEARRLSKQVPDIAVTSSANHNIEINHIEAQKGCAVRWLAERLSIPLEKVMAIGDNLNDLSMMKVAGFPVAMGNAEPELKNFCRFVTRSHDENGVAHAIRTYIS